MTDATKTCEYFVTLLDAFYDGELSASESAEVKEHMDTCDQCCLRLGQIEQVVSVLRSLPRLEPKKDLSKGLDKFKQEPLPNKNRVRQLVVLGSLSVAAVALVLFMAGTFMVHKKREPARISSQIKSEPMQPRQGGREGVYQEAFSPEGIPPGNISQTEVTASNTRDAQRRLSSPGGVLVPATDRQRQRNIPRKYRIIIADGGQKTVAEETTRNQPNTAVDLDKNHIPASRSQSSAAGAGDRLNRLTSSDLPSAGLLAFESIDQTTVYDELGIMTNEDGLYALKL